MTHHTILDQQTLPEEKGGMDQLNPLLQKLPAGQRRVARALIAGDDARTYRQVASRLRLHRGTVSQQLRRMRLQDPPTYAALMEFLSLATPSVAGHALCPCSDATPLHYRDARRRLAHRRRWKTRLRLHSRRRCTTQVVFAKFPARLIPSSARLITERDGVFGMPITLAERTWPDTRGTPRRP